MCDFDIVEQSAPSYIYFRELNEAIGEFKRKFQLTKETINKNSIKCIFLGNTSVGKSTVINALLGGIVVNNDITEGTTCVTQCQATDKNIEYFNLKNDTSAFNKGIEISELKFISKRFQNLKMAPGINCLIDVYLNKSNYTILQNHLALVDCPAYDTHDIISIMNYCENGDIFVFCFEIKKKITENDLKLMRDIMNKAANCKFIILFTKCDNNNDLNINAERQSEIKQLDFDKDSIYFISGREELLGNIDCERHQEFINFRKHLEESSKALKMGIRNVFLEVITDLTSIIKCMQVIIPKIPIENSENLDSMFSSIGLNIETCNFEEIDHKIKETIGKIRTLYYKDQSVEALSNYSDKANKEITEFLIVFFLKNTSINEAPNLYGFFHGYFIQCSKIEKMEFHFLESGTKRRKIKKHFLEYYEKNKLDIYSNVKKHYKEKVQIFFNEWIKFKDNLKKYISELELKSI